MTDYIKKEDAEYALVSHFMPQTYTGEDVDQAFHLAKSIMSDVPSADVAPVRHGRWIEEKLPFYRWGGEKIGEKSTWECSECHDVGFWGYNYCPNCGARMDGDEDE